MSCLHKSSGIRVVEKEKKRERGQNEEKRVKSDRKTACHHSPNIPVIGMERNALDEATKKSAKSNEPVKDLSSFSFFLSLSHPPFFCDSSISHSPSPW